MNIAQTIADSIAVKQGMLADDELIALIKKISEAAIRVYQNGGKLLFCGNGGSAADAQHIAAELSGRFTIDRPPLFAEALHVNSSYMTAVSNDYGFNIAYARLVEAMGRPGDMLVAISTSGNSPNILEAVKAAKKAGMMVVGMSGQSGGKMREWCDYTLCVPSANTARIQEAHILVGHIVCDIIENTLFGK
ncbi:MAG TPA: D-sedoheptulose 7-phosphate isomerase [Bacteroidales bacterium]|nr:D-sedoheptulose 7-phosphate isomerase [Bacteroidales bacterium]